MVAEGASRVKRLVFVVNALATSRQDGSHTDLTIAEKQWLEANGTCHQPEVKQGQLFLWMSGLPHANVVLPGPTGTTADYEDSYRVLVNGAPHGVFHPAELATRAEALCHEGQSSGDGDVPGRVGRVVRTDLDRFGGIRDVHDAKTCPPVCYERQTPRHGHSPGKAP